VIFNASLPSLQRVPALSDLGGADSDRARGPGISHEVGSVYRSTHEEAVVGAILEQAPDGRRASASPGAKVTFLNASC
jgi:hypothetical protein